MSGLPYFVRSQIRYDFRDKQGAWEDFLAPLKKVIGSCFPFGSGESSLQGSPQVLYDRARALARRGDKRGAIVNLQQAAVLFRAQGNTNRYREVQNLISQLRR
jgi:hypothetical protein